MKLTLLLLTLALSCVIHASDKFTTGPVFSDFGQHAGVDMTMKLDKACVLRWHSMSPKVLAKEK